MTMKRTRKDPDDLRPEYALDYARAKPNRFVRKRAKPVASERRPTRRRKIDFSDIPEASDAQLKAMRRVGRPPLGNEPRTIIAIRLDPQLLTAFRREARRRQIGYQTLIHEVLAAHLK